MWVKIHLKYGKAFFNFTVWFNSNDELESGFDEFFKLALIKQFKIVSKYFKTYSGLIEIKKYSEFESDEKRREYILECFNTINSILKSHKL